jgi:pyrophosphatase PpaX
MKLKPAAILFDMDGVLIDSLGSWLKSLNHALRYYNKKEISLEEFVEKYWGHDLFDNLTKMDLPIEVGLFCNKVYGDHLDGIKIFPETKNVLEKLKNYKKSIITNTPNDCAVQILRNFDIERFFEFVLTSDDVSMAKPDPEIVLKSCEKMDVDPLEAVLVGDTLSDVRAGRAVGCTVIGIKVDADITINDISELLGIIFV